MKKLTLAASLILAAAAAASPALAKTKIYFSIARTDDKFINILGNTVSAEAAKDADIDLTYLDAKNNGQTQLDQIKQGIADHADVVMLLPVDGPTAQAAGELAVKAHVPLIFLNRMPPSDRFNGQVAIVASNDLVAGRLQMRLIADKLGNAGNVVILRGEDGHPAAIGRTQGVKEILATRPNIHLTEEVTGNWKRSEGERFVTQWLSSGQPINAILANNDEMALGAIDALQKAKIPPGKILVAGVDGTADALSAIHSGYLTVSLLQNAKAQGEQALADAKKLAGKQYAELYDWVPYELIIPSNVATYAGQ